MGASAAVASAIAVPLAAATNWRAALAFWAIPAFVVAGLWLVRVRSVAGPASAAAAVADGGELPGSVWRQPAAWLLTAYMGLQSVTFYILVTWLPTIEADAGTSEQQAGVHLFVYQMVGILAGLAIPFLMRGTGSQAGAAVTASVPMLVAVAGLLVAPSLGFIWAFVAGLGSGPALVVALALISLSGRSHDETAQLSGMAQFLGYLLAATGPVLAGVLAGATDSWQPSLLLLGALAVVQLLVAVGAGRVPTTR